MPKFTVGVKYRYFCMSCDAGATARHRLRCSFCCERMVAMYRVKTAGWTRERSVRCAVNAFWRRIAHYSCPERGKEF